MRVDFSRGGGFGFIRCSVRAAARSLGVTGSRSCVGSDIVLAIVGVTGVLGSIGSAGGAAGAADGAADGAAAAGAVGAFCVAFDAFSRGQSSDSPSWSSREYRYALAESETPVKMCSSALGSSLVCKVGFTACEGLGRCHAVERASWTTVLEGPFTYSPPPSDRSVFKSRPVWVLTKTLYALK
ncbi:hypothetical protein EXIGLDRAFT_57511 [Exidia glandulosa HHB12029]|uniref:Uncharacterized protein n=1 Tax=Exidia glandulosa HHB12029 TaxID=1314781 RepID=A0A166MMZ5_EXIGL|nr:hypothetical protein EXIGLDRAFT_57511 [Exidia glandulosa HHB12029]